MMQGPTLNEVGATQQQVNKSTVGSALSDADSVVNPFQCSGSTPGGWADAKQSGSTVYGCWLTSVTCVCVSQLGDPGTCSGVSAGR
jgi:hypothetical protein